MLWTDCKLELFVNGAPLYKPIIQFLNWLARFQLYKVNLSCLETRPNGLKAGWINGLEAGSIFYKQPKWHESCTSLPNKQPVAWRVWKLAKLLTKHALTSMIVLQARQSNNSIDQILTEAIHDDVSWVSLVRLTSKAKTNTKNNGLAWLPGRVLQLLSFIATRRLLTMHKRC